MSDHHVTIRLQRTLNGTPYKWAGECVCGWHCLSWAWSRAYDAANDPAFLAEGNSPEGGTLPMALEHLAEKQAEINEAIASIRRADDSVRQLQAR